MSTRIRFGRFELLPTERRLLDSGRPVAVGARAFDLLNALIERRDRLVGKAELLDVVWPGLVVEEANLTMQVSTLRRLIGSQVIATVPGLGYRFAMPLCGVDATPATDSVTFAAARVRTNVPAPVDALFGREVELQELPRSMADHRLVTVLGAGGVGKSRFVQAVAREWDGKCAHGVWWVDLAALSSADKLAPGIASAVRLPLGEGDALALLVNLLADRDLLLVIDNCEHLAADVASVVAALLGGAERLRILATSQVALKVAGEHIYALAPLPVAPSNTPLHAARRFGALQLLEHRARAADARFQLTDGNVELACDLCSRLDGIALAIEMAAARLPVLGLQGLHDRLGERLDILHGTTRDARHRQQTLRATLDWSHALLNADERAVLRRLAVFAGSFRLDAAIRVAQTLELDEWRVLDALTGLVDKSLVNLEQLEPPRYRLFDTMRLYAGERLAEAGEGEAALACHGAAMVQLAEEAEHSGLAEAAWLRRYGPDYYDLLEAFERACKRLDADCAAGIVGALRLLDRVRGVLTHSRRLVEAAHAMLPHAGPLGQARLCTVIAYFGWIAVGHTSRLATASRAAVLWRSLRHPQELHQALSRVAMECARNGAFGDADLALSEAQEIEQSDWPPKVRKLRAFAVGVVAATRGEAETFRDAMKEALALSEDAGEERYVAHASVELARAALMAGTVDEAITLSRKAIVKYGALDQPVFRGVALVTLCTCLLMAGDLSGARAAAMQAMPLLEGSYAKGFLLSPVTLLAALTGACETAGLLLAYAEKWHASIENPRDWIELRVAEQASLAIDASLGRSERVRLRDAGVQLSDSRAMALARESLVDESAKPEEVHG